MARDVSLDGFAAMSDNFKCSIFGMFLGTVKLGPTFLKSAVKLTTWADIGYDSLKGDKQHYRNVRRGKLSYKADAYQAIERQKD